MGDHAPPGRGLTLPVEMGGRQGDRGDRGHATAGIFPPRNVDLEMAEAGRRLFAREARFVAGASEASALPPGGLPEIALAGRSNVGKSSLINALTGRRTLARTSNSPGRTRQINFFELGGRLMLVDLPGYGYAGVPKAAIRSWTALVRHYLRTRAALRRVCLLLDARHGVKEIDRPLMGMLDDAGVSYQLVLTKTDKAGAGELSRIVAQVTAEIAIHAAAHPEVHLTSAVRRTGIAELHETLVGVALPITPAGPSAALEQ
jgi:GTP-binding protein